MEEKELWTKKWKERLEGYTEPLPSSSWEELEKKLTPMPDRRLFPHRKWIAVAASVALVLGTSLSIYFLHTPLATQIREIEAPVWARGGDVLPSLPHSSQPTPATDQMGSIYPSSTNLLLAKQQQETQLPTKPFSEPNSDQTEVTTSLSDQTSTTHTTTDQSIDVDKPAEPTNSGAETTRQPRKPSGKDKLHLPEQKKYNRSKGWSLGASISHAGAISSNEAGLEPQMSLSRLDVTGPAHGIVQIPEDKTVVFHEGVPYLQSSNDVVDIKHRQPIAYGLSVRKSLPKGFSVETGLTYTLLSSDVKLVKSTTTESQRLHYIGIPIRANWNMVDKKLFTIYLSAGGAVEKCVYGEQAGEKLSVNPLQLSVMGAVGAQLNATKQLGVYIEPGVVHFFDDGSDVQTIRKDNSVNFNLQAGVRFTY